MTTSAAEHAVAADDPVAGGIAVSSRGRGRAAGSQVNGKALGASGRKNMDGGIGYRVVETFDPTWRSGWLGYIAWSKLAHLKEVVGLDCLLCPSAIRVESKDDWDHVLYGGYLSAVFDDWQYAMSKLPPDKQLDTIQIIAVLREPSEEQVRDLAPIDFDFVGFDLIEEETSISALNNCVHFNDVLGPLDLNQQGLISELVNAYDIRRRLREKHPEEPHADCAVWALWRKRSA